MSSLSFVQMAYDWDGRNDLSGEESVGMKHNAPPSKCVNKALISRQTLRHFSTLDLTQTFE